MGNENKGACHACEPMGELNEKQAARIKELEALEKKNAILMEAVEFYSDIYDSDLIAKEALEKIKALNK